METPNVDIVGLGQIAERLGVQPDTATRWRDSRTSGFPEEDGQLGKRSPWWHWHRVEEWAIATGRLEAVGTWQ